MFTALVVFWLATHPCPPVVPPPKLGVLPGEVPRDVSPDPKPTSSR